MSNLTFFLTFLTFFSLGELTFFVFPRDVTPQTTPNIVLVGKPVFTDSPDYLGYNCAFYNYNPATVVTCQKK